MRHLRIQTDCCRFGYPLDIKMDLRYAVDQALIIVGEERTLMTVRYQLAAGPGRLPTIFTLSPNPYDWQRDHRPRTIRLSPSETTFKSENFNHLGFLANQLSESERLSFAKSLALRIGLRDSYIHKPGEVLTAGTAKQCSSELPLIAEFLVRRGAKEVFLSVLSRPPASPGLTLMLMQLEDMIAFNYTLFTREEYELLGSRLQEIEQSIDLMLAGPKPIEPRDRNATHHVSKELPAQVKILREAARKAIYLHVSGVLRESSSEVNSPVPLPIPNTIAASAPTLSEPEAVTERTASASVAETSSSPFPAGSRLFSKQLHD